MRSALIFFSVQLLAFQPSFGQSFPEATYQAGFTIFKLIDSTRIYKPGTTIYDSLHLRPLEIDVWYPSEEKKQHPLLFRDLFSLFERRASKYGNENYNGLMDELAVYFMAELGLELDPEKLLNVRTESFLQLKPVATKLPVVIYMAGFNGMGFENYKMLEQLAQEGFLVLSIWSVGRYPGNMSNKMDDMMEQVYDAEAALKHLKNITEFSADLNHIGVIGTSWGGVSAAALTARHPEIKSFVSLDGSEIHYFGKEGDVDKDGKSNDAYVAEIHDANVLTPTTQTVSYLYLESGDKLNDFNPVSEFNYFKQLSSEKKYLRFLESKHADFLCIPSILNASPSSVRTYQEIIDITVAFFDDNLNEKKDFDEYWSRISTSSHISTEPYIYAAPGKIDSFKNKLSGKVLDTKTKQPLPYVSIGVLNGQTGTITNEKGEFELDIQEEHLKDTLKLSMIGYHSQERNISDMVRDNSAMVILLEERTEALEEILVYGKAYQKKVLGNKSESKFISAGFSYEQLGAEVGIRINVRKNPTFVDDFTFSVAHNRLSATSVFRLNFYDVKNGKPGENILSKNIFIEIEPKQTGVISIDLKSYNIILHDDVFATLEWVENNGETKEGEAIYFSLGMLNNGTIHKPASQAKFRKYNSLGVGFNISVRQ